MITYTAHIHIHLKKLLLLLLLLRKTDFTCKKKKLLWTKERGSSFARFKASLLADLIGHPTKVSFAIAVGGREDSMFGSCFKYLSEHQENLQNRLLEGCIIPQKRKVPYLGFDPVPFSYFDAHYH